MFWKSVTEDMQNVVTCTEQLGMAQEFQCEDVKLLLAVVTKHFLWHSEYPVQKNNLELRAYIIKALRKPMVLINKELHWVLQNWKDIIAFMMSGTHLDREVHTAEDLWDPVQQGIGSYLQTLRNKAKGSGRAPKTSTKTTVTYKSATEKGTCLQQQEGHKDSGDKDTRVDRNIQQ